MSNIARRGVWEKQFPLSPHTTNSQVKVLQIFLSEQNVYVFTSSPLLVSLYDQRNLQKKGQEWGPRAAHPRRIRFTRTLLCSTLRKHDKGQIQISIFVKFSSYYLKNKRNYSKQIFYLMERYPPREVTMTIEKSKNNGLTRKLKTPFFGL